MKKSKQEAKRQWRTSISKVTKGEYLSIGIPKIDNKGFQMRFGYGYIHELEKIQSNPLLVIKSIISKFPLPWSKEEAKNKLDEEFKKIKSIKKEGFEKHKGFEILTKLFNYFDIFDSCKKTKSISLNDVVLQLIYQRIKKPMSVFNAYKSIKKDNIDTYSKNSFYRSLDYIAENKDTILKNINKKISSNFDREINILWFDSTTSYFETFAREGYKKPGFSKDGKFKEDQIVIGMATDSNGIPLHYKIFLGNTAYSKTFIPFMLEISKIYNINETT